MNRDDDIAAVILAEAADLGAGVIVLGTRGLGGVKSPMLGSVSHAVLHHADREHMNVTHGAGDCH